MTATEIHQQVVALPVEQVHPDPHNVRGDVGDVNGLADSIRDRGLLQPVVVRPSGDDEPDGWMLIAGHRRHAAHVLLEEDFIDAIVREGPEATDVEVVAAQLIENVQRQDLDPSAEARAYHRLAGLGWSQRQIADAVGVSQGQVSKRIKLADLPDGALTALDQGRCTVEDLLALSTLYGEDRDAAVQVVESELFDQADFELTVSRRHRKHAEAVQEARDAHERGEGPPVHPKSDERPYGVYDVRGAMPVGDHRLKDVDRGQMADDGTLAVLVDRSGRTHEVCTSPQRYLKQAEGKRTKSPGEVAAQRRDEFVRQIFDDADPWAPPAHYRMLIDLLPLVLRTRNSSELHTICAWLGLDVKKSAYKHDLEQALLALVQGSGRVGNETILAARKIAQAVLWEGCESYLAGAGQHTHTPLRPEHVAYLDALVAAGYEPTDPEREWLARDEDDADG